MPIFDIGDYWWGRCGGLIEDYGLDVRKSNIGLFVVFRWIFFHMIIIYELFDRLMVHSFYWESFFLILTDVYLPVGLVFLIFCCHQIISLICVPILHHFLVSFVHLYVFHVHILYYSFITFNFANVYFSSTVSETYFHIGELFPFSNILFSISIKKCCWGPNIDPGRAILIQPIKSGAWKW